MEVVEGGLFTTVQDLGRYGYQRYGVPVSGAMDPYALRMSNVLLGNPEGAAVLEITLVGPKLRFLAETTIVLGGTDLAPRLDGQSVPMWRVLRVSGGSLLSFDGPMAGMRTYLAVPGGIDVPTIMGSKSTYVRGTLGGFQGRILKPGDRLPALPDGNDPSPTGTRVPSRLISAHGHEHRLRVVMGPQADAFTPEGIATFLSSTYTVSRQSDRVGYRLEGPAIDHLKGADIISDGIPFGAVQVTGDGLPVVLMADRGTTGGYTKIAAVISVDIGKLAQAIPGDMVTFQAVSMEEAHRHLKEQECGLQEFKGRVDRAREMGPSGLRVMVDSQAFEVTGDGGDALTQVEPLQEKTQSSRRTVTATVNGRSYTFEVEVEEPE